MNFIDWSGTAGTVLFLVFFAGSIAISFWLGWQFGKHIFYRRGYDDARAWCRTGNCPAAQPDPRRGW